MKKSIAIIIVILTMVISIGCSNELPKPKVAKSILNIGFLSEQMFEMHYAQALSNIYPDFRYNIISMMDIIKKKVSVQQWFEAHQDQLDLLYIPSSYFQEFINLNLIMDIETFVRKDNYSLDPFLPATINLTKQYGGGDRKSVV